MVDGKRGVGLTTVFWIAACGNIMLVAIPALDEWRHPGGEFSGLVVFGLALIVAFLAAVSVVVAIIRRPLAYGIGLALVCVPMTWWTSMAARNYLEILAAPSEQQMATGRWMFPTLAEGALADAVIAGDAAKVGTLAPGARLDAQGQSGMTFMRLALENGHAKPDVVAALLKAGLDPDQNQGLLFGDLNAFGISNGLSGGTVLIGAKNEPLLRAIIDAKVDLKQRWGFYPRYFTLFPWPEGLAVALDHGANPEAADNAGNTAIMMAVMYEYWPAIDVLLAHGARTDHVDQGGKSLRDLVNERLGYLSKDHPPPQLSALAARLR